MSDTSTPPAKTEWNIARIVAGHDNNYGQIPGVGILIASLETFHNAERVALQAQLTAAKTDHVNACKLVADMHAAAVGEIRGPILGIVEDVANLREALRKITEDGLDARQCFEVASAAMKGRP